MVDPVVEKRWLRPARPSPAKMALGNVQAQAAAMAAGGPPRLTQTTAIISNSAAPCPSLPQQPPCHSVHRISQVLLHSPAQVKRLTATFHRFRPQRCSSRKAIPTCALVRPLSIHEAAARPLMRREELSDIQTWLPARRCNQQDQCRLQRWTHFPRYQAVTVDFMV